MLAATVIAWAQGNQTYFQGYDMGAICEWLFFHTDFFARFCLA